VHEVAGAVNADCSLQACPPTVVTSKQRAPGEYQLTFPQAEFSDTPVLMLTPIGGGNPGGISESQNPDGTWNATYTFAQPTLVNFRGQPVNTVTLRWRGCGRETAPAAKLSARG
jgi:hypothetical protein